MAMYDDIKRSDAFASRMKSIRSRYYKPDGERIRTINVPDDVNLLYELLDDLEEYTRYGHRVDSFRLGDKSNYLRAKRTEYRKNNGRKESDIDLGIVSGAQKAFWGAEWEHQARKEEYRAMVGTVDFFEAVESILSEIRTKSISAPTFEKSDAIEKLVSKSCGIPKIDALNQKLLQAFNKSFEQDLENYEEKQRKSIEEKIQMLREKSLYKYNGSKTRFGDNKCVGKEGSSMTFNSLFNSIRNISRSASYKLVTKEERVYPNNQDNSFSKRIESLGDLIQELEASQKQMNAEQEEHGLYIEEKDRLGKLNEDIYGKIANVKKLYEQIRAKEKRFSKVILTVDVLNNEIAHLDAAIMTLNSNGGYVFKNTVSLLSKIRNNYAKELEKHKDLIKSLNELFDKVPSIQREIELLREPCREIIDTGKEKKEAKEKGQQLLDKEHQARLDAQEKQQQLDREAIIEKIKNQVIREMSFLNMGPRIINVDGADHWEEDYTDFNIEFKKRLAQALRSNNISYSDADLTSPYEPLKPEEREKDRDGIIKLRKIGDGYYMTYSDFDYLFTIFERQARMHYSWNDYTYEQVIGELEYYLQNMYGDSIINKEEYEEIKKNRHNLFQEKHGLHHI